MNDESKQGAPGGASPVCEICGRDVSTGEGFFDVADRCKANPTRCYRLGYERLRSRLSTAEKARQRDDLNWSKALRECHEVVATAEKERDEALRLVGKAEDAYAGSVICHEILAFMEAAGCGRPGVPNTLWAMTKELIARTQAAEDAAPAAKESPDSSALEKALGALRAVEWERDIARDILRKTSLASGAKPGDGMTLPELVESTRLDRECMGARCGYLETILRRVRFNFPAQQEPTEQLLAAIDAALSGGAHVDGPKAALGTCDGNRPQIAHAETTDCAGRWRPASGNPDATRAREVTCTLCGATMPTPDGLIVPHGCPGTPREQAKYAHLQPPLPQPGPGDRAEKEGET